MSLTISAQCCPAYESFGECSAVMPAVDYCFDQTHAFASVWEIELTTAAELGLVLAPNVSAHVKGDLVLKVEEGLGFQTAVAMHNNQDPAHAVRAGDLVLNNRVAGCNRILRIARWAWSVTPQRSNAGAVEGWLNVCKKAPLGITMMGPPKAGRISVLEIQPGTPFAEWNRAYPHLAVQPGDELLSVEDPFVGMSMTLAGSDLATFTAALKNAWSPKVLVLRVPHAFRR